MKRVIRVFAAIVLIAIVAFALSDLSEHITPIKADRIETCKLEHWTFRAAGGGDFYTYIDGSTSCTSGRITIRAFDGETFLGNTSAHIRGRAFSAILEGKAPKELTIRYSIEP